MMNDEMGSSSKMQSLMDLVKTMKEMHGQNAKPQGLAIEIEGQHELSPDEVEKLEEETHEDLDGDNEQGESAEHKAKVFGKPMSTGDIHSDDESSDDSQDSSEDSDHDSELSDMLKKLLMDKLSQ